MIKNLISDTHDFMKRFFHKRNIIIVSEHKVKHIPISGTLQFAGVVIALTMVCWASYSTGSFFAARHTLKEQGQALRSFASARLESSFSNPAASAAQKSAEVSSSPHIDLSKMDNTMLVAKIAELESKVSELKNANEVIINRVQDKTAGRIDELESIIKQTGINPEDLKKQFAVENKATKGKTAQSDAAGGPFIATNVTNLTPQAQEMFGTLDEYALLKQVLSGLPLSMPIKNAEAQSGFGHRVDPFNGHLAFHSGLDLAGPAGSRIYSAANGVVVFTGRSGAYGNCVDIDHGHGIVTRYGHLSQIMVEEGKKVAVGDVIGVQGSTGRATGPHLHYEVRYNDQPLNPKKFLDAGAYVLEE